MKNSFIRLLVLFILFAALVFILGSLPQSTRFTIVNHLFEPWTGYLKILLIPASLTLCVMAFFTYFESTRSSPFVYLSLSLFSILLLFEVVQEYSIATPLTLRSTLIYSAIICTALEFLRERKRVKDADQERVSQNSHYQKHHNVKHVDHRSHFTRGSLTKK
jgi:hypothetical protein